MRFYHVVENPLAQRVELEHKALISRASKIPDWRIVSVEADGIDRESAEVIYWAAPGLIRQPVRVTWFLGKAQNVTLLTPSGEV